MVFCFFFYLTSSTYLRLLIILKGDPVFVRMFRSCFPSCKPCKVTLCVKSSYAFLRTILQCSGRKIKIFTPLLRELLAVDPYRAASGIATGEPSEFDLGMVQICEKAEVVKRDQQRKKGGKRNAS